MVEKNSGQQNNQASDQPSTPIGKSEHSEAVVAPARDNPPLPPNPPNNVGGNLTPPNPHPEQNHPPHTPVGLLEEKKLTQFEKYMVRLTVLGILIASATAYFIYGQFSGLADQNKILAAQGESAAAGAAIDELNTGKQIKAAQDQAKAAQGSVDAITRQMRLDQRPWLQITVQMQQVIRENEGVNGVVHITNSGKTPARKLVVIAVLAEIHNGNNIQFRYEGVPRTVAVIGDMVPNVPSEDIPVKFERATGPRPQDIEPILLKKPDLDALGTGKYFFIIYVLANYEDIFKIPHWTRMCGWKPYKPIEAPSGAGFTAKQCTQYADVDNNESTAAVPGDPAAPN